MEGKSNHIIDFKDNANVFLNNGIENKVDGRRNAFSIYAGRGADYMGMGSASIYKIYLYGILPSLTYSFGF